MTEDEIMDFTEQVKERKMAVLFEHFKDVDIPAARKIAQAEGLAKGRAEGQKEGEERFARLAQFLLQDSRKDDLIKTFTDLEYRKRLYGEYHL